MKLQPRETSLPLSLRAISEWEERVFRQRQLIADLILRGESSKAAETNLKRDQAFLNQLRNHRQTMELLTQEPRAPVKALRRKDISKL